MYQAETYNLGAKVEVMDSDSSEDKDDDSVDPKHGDESKFPLLHLIKIIIYNNEYFLNTGVEEED